MIAPHGSATGRSRQGRGKGTRVSAGLGALALAWVAAGTACTDTNDALLILQAQDPNDQCVVEDNADTLRIDRGVLDVALDKPYGYELLPLVSNNLAPIAAAGEIEPNRVVIEAAQMKILPPPGLRVGFTELCSPEFEAPANAVIFPQNVRVVSVQVLRSCHAALIRDLFRAGALDSNLAVHVDFRVEVRMRGRHGGTSIVSDPFVFPIRVCHGCLQTGFSGQFAVFNYPNVPACEELQTNDFRGNTCNGRIAQDHGPILCCAPQGDITKLQCPGIPAAPRTP